MNDLTPEQLQRLREFAAEHGRNWRAKLKAMWWDGTDAQQRDGHLLRQVRNNGSWDFNLDKVKL